MSRLAIVIPAFKIQFFRQTLESIAFQTCTDFTLYIGDDESPANLESIVDLFRDKINIKYVRFTQNLGGKDLVAHWERCIDLTTNEDWIWLFSDDDIMDSTCVENFYNTLEAHPNYDLFHFNKTKIDEENNVIEICFSYPEVLTVEQLLIGRLDGQISSWVIEYVFRKSTFLNVNRFQNFDLAWGSDDATWIKLGKKSGIKPIEKSKVHWRESRFNISPNNWNESFVTRKLQSQIEFAKWVIGESKEITQNSNELIIRQKIKNWFYYALKYKSRYISLNATTKLLQNFNRVLKPNGLSSREIIFLYLYQVYCFCKYDILGFGRSIS